MDAEDRPARGGAGRRPVRAHPPRGALASGRVHRPRQPGAAVSQAPPSGPRGPMADSLARRPVARDQTTRRQTSQDRRAAHCAGTRATSRAGHAIETRPQPSRTAGVDGMCAEVLEQ